MKKYILLVCCFCASFLSAEHKLLPKVRVFCNPDNTISVTYFIDKAKNANESDSEFMDRETEENFYGLPYIDMYPKDLPSGETRHQWRWREVKGQKEIWIDTSIEKPKSKIQLLEERIKALEAK